MTSSPWPPPPVAAVLLLLAGWTIWCGGRIARVASVSLAHRLAAGLTALLVVPGGLLWLALGSVETSGAVREGAWLWPVACLAALPQPLAALGRDRAPGWLAWPVAAWNLVAVVDMLARGADLLGVAWPDPLVPVLGAPRAAWSDAVGTSALAAPWTLVVPLVVPVWPPRVRLTRVVHVLLVVVACVGVGASALGGLRLASVASSYRRFAADPLRERPAGDFAVGVEAFGAVASQVPATVARLDELSLEQLEVTAVGVELSAATPRAALDSLGRILDPRRRAGAAIIVTVRDLPMGASDSTLVSAIARRTGATTLVVSGPWERQPLDRLAAAVARRAAAARAAARPGLQVAIAVGADEPRRHAWAAAPGSGIDEIVLRLAPSSAGADALGRQLATWSAWIAETGSLRSYWLVGAGGVPAAHGPTSQRLAVRGALAWATSERMVRGALVGPVTDIGALTGLRSASHAWRPAAGTLLQAGRSIRETRAPTMSPAPIDTVVP